MDVAMRMVRGWVGVLLLTLIAAQPAALAVAPTGACCLPDGSCQDLIAPQCDDLNAQFIGEETSCMQIDCSRPVAAPVLSIFGLIAILGALGGLGVRSLMSRREA